MNQNLGLGDHKRSKVENIPNKPVLSYPREISSLSYFMSQSSILPQEEEHYWIYSPLQAKTPSFVPHDLFPILWLYVASWIGIGRWPVTIEASSRLQSEQLIYRSLGQDDVWLERDLGLRWEC